jgi:probable phosphoglycerate mutase
MIFFIRHGETEWNREHRYQGALDSPLSEYGKSQIQLVCSIFKQEPELPPLLKVYVSPLGRAVETAEILTRHINVELIEEERLREISLGSWDGLTQDEVRLKFPNVLNDAKPYNWHFKSPDGERLSSAKKRVVSWLSDVRGQTVCAIAHGLIGRVLIGVYLGLRDEEFLKLAIAQDAYYKIHDGKAYAIGKGVLNSDEA